MPHRFQFRPLTRLLLPGFFIVGSDGLDLFQLLGKYCVILFRFVSVRMQYLKMFRGVICSRENNSCTDRRFGCGERLMIIDGTLPKDF